MISGSQFGAYMCLIARRLHNNLNVNLDKQLKNIFEFVITPVGLIDIDVCHAEEFVQALTVVLLNGAENGRQDEIVTLKQER